MSDDASFVGVTTVMFPLNSPSATVGFSDTSEGNNTILNSSHPGTVQGLLADGSVQTLSDGLDINLLLRLCVADDGQFIDDF